MTRKDKPTAKRGEGSPLGAAGEAKAGGIWKIALPWALFAVTAIAFAGFAIAKANEAKVTKGNVGEEAVATVDGEAITANEVYHYMLDLYGPQSVEQLILEKLVGREAERRNIVVTEEDLDKEIEKLKTDFPDEETFHSMMELYGVTVEKLKEQMKPQLLLKKLIEPEIEITEEEMQAYYEENKSEFVTSPEQVKASHILVETREEAEKLLEEIRSGADFAELAKEHSKDPGSAENGGDLGFFGRGAMVEPFEEAAFSLDVGEISDIVETAYGYHIIKVTDKQEEVTAPYEDSKEKVRETLLERKISERSSSFLEELRTAANIENALETGATDAS